MRYEFDVFLSYTRQANAGEWVKNHFHPVLYEALDNHMPREPEIFIDYEMGTGIDWPKKLETSLQRSRLVVAVLSPPYFRSKWCVAEWKTMSEREKTLGYATNANPEMLIHPVVYADGTHFPGYAQRNQSYDLSTWNYPYPQFRESRDYLKFHNAVYDFAADLAPKIDTVPPWQDTWPVYRPEPEPTVRADLPTL